MFATRRPTGRFTLLLLDENEFYVRDFVATCTWPSEVGGNWNKASPLPGQLRLCTKSIFFEPDDVRIPIVRLPFQYLEQLEGSGKQEVIAIAQRLSKMKANAADEPYIFEKGLSSEWKFKLTYAALGDFMPLVQRMLVASRLPQADQETLLEEVLSEVEGALRFDPGHLRSPSTEIIALEVPAMRLAPLVKEPCRLAVTTTRLYMQPLHNITGDAAVRSHPLAAVAGVARRRSALKDVGMEVFFVDPPAEAGLQGPLWGTASAFFTFKTQEERNRAVESITSQASMGKVLPGGRPTAAACGTVLEAGGGWLPRITAAWQHGRLTNFDYLLYCNLAAGRSFNDLTQYPVFPWVLQDYVSSTLDLNDSSVFRDLSRPIGALNPTRLAQYKERYDEMKDHPIPGGDPPFLYGTHYSCPGYTMFWLVRAAPAHMLRLQNGRFDAPDRLFCSVSEAWKSVMTNNADVKELIPEFYMPERPEFLVNGRRLALGLRQDGRQVGDVELPPWAQRSPERFLAMHRAALESPFVSANLHHWLDLIFGVKQRGAAAEQADNVFRHLTYEGAIDPENISDRVLREAAEVAINEFGQCPRQIFNNPHPPRLVCPPPPQSLPLTPGPRALSGTTPSHAQSLSLTLISAIISTLEDEQHPQALEISPLLRELDVAAAHTRRQQQLAGIAAESSGASGGGHFLMGSHPGSRSGSAGSGFIDPGRDDPQMSASTTRQDGDEGGSTAGLGSSPFASAKAGLMGRWNALKDAVGDAQQRTGGGSRGLIGSIGSRGSSGTAALLSNQSARLSAIAGSLSSRWSTTSGSSTGKMGFDQGVVQRSTSTGPLAEGMSTTSSTINNANANDGVSPKNKTKQGGVGDTIGATTSSLSAGKDGLNINRHEKGSTAVQAVEELPVVWKTAAPRTGNAPRLQEESDNTEEREEGGGVYGTAPSEEAQAPGGTSQDLLVAGAPGGLCRTSPSREGPLLNSQKESTWGLGLRDRLHAGRSFVAGSESVNSVQLAFADGVPCAYTAGHDGSVRVFDAASGTQLRAAHLGGGQPLTSLALLPSGEASVTARKKHPAVLCGSYDGNVYVYNPSTGAIAGKFSPHSDAVSCIALSPEMSGASKSSTVFSNNSAALLATSSWDCSLKLWSLSEGRQPWNSTLPQPVAALENLPGGVWALALDPQGAGALIGTEEGLVVFIDLRQPGSAKPVWEQELCQDYIGGVSWVPGSAGQYALAAAANGTLSLLDSRRNGAPVSSVSCGTSLRCCVSDGAVALAGGESGAVMFWDVGQQLERPPAAGNMHTAPRLDGLYPALTAQPASAVGAIAVNPWLRRGGTEKEGLCLATGHDGGVVRVYWAE